VNSIWEGSGNVMCLDVMRVMTRHPESIAALRQELALARGAHPDFDRAFEALERRLKATPDVLEAQARWLTQRLAQCLQAALLLRHAPAAIGETFCAARLGEETSPLFGVLPSHAPLDAILERIMP